jgi:hypothetical protein
MGLGQRSPRILECDDQVLDLDILSLCFPAYRLEVGAKIAFGTNSRKEFCRDATAQGVRDRRVQVWLTNAIILGSSPLRT